MRYISTTRTAILAGLVSAAALALLAAPAGATLVCPPGTTNPKYCTNHLPVATTNAASAVSATSATLNGVSGPGVAGGDATHYYFQYGKTTAYGAQTPTGTATGCPAGVTNPTVTNPQSCSPTQNVSARIKGLKPGQTYHFRIVSTNPDSASPIRGADLAFTTLQPIKSVTSPARVRHGHVFTVVVSLNVRSVVVITLRFKGSVVRSFNKGFQTGTFRQRITAPVTAGLYILRVKATAAGVTQTVNRKLTVF